MKYVKYNNFPKLRRAYGSAAEMADAILHSESYIHQRLNGRFEFTYKEKKRLLECIGKTEADIPEYFPDYSEKERETA